MSDDQDDSQKTEDPTQKRLEDARKKGQIASSREINHFFILIAFAIILLILSPYMMREATMIMRPFIVSGYDISMDSGNFRHSMINLVGDIGYLMLIPFALTISFALAAGFSQSGMNVSAESIKPKLEKISVIKGLKRMFSMKSVVEFLKGILKISLVGLIATLAIYPNMDTLRLLPNMEILQILGFTVELAAKMLMGVLFVMFVIAGMDYTYQKFEYMKQMRMSKQDIKDEYKQQEGDPIIKQKLRAIRMERSRKRMMANVPDSDVVITNPTHVSVALKYDPMTMEAPEVMAMGKDKVALKIREIAKENKITIVRNPPLARALFENSKVEEPIPLEHYKAVAQVIGYVYRLQGRELAAKAAGKL